MVVELIMHIDKHRSLRLLMFLKIFERKNPIGMQQTKIKKSLLFFFQKKKMVYLLQKQKLLSEKISQLYAVLHNPIGLKKN